jgi:hypothetical protein
MVGRGYAVSVAGALAIGYPRRGRSSRMVVARSRFFRMGRHPCIGNGQCGTLHGAAVPFQAVLDPEQGLPVRIAPGVGDGGSYPRCGPAVHGIDAEYCL